MPKVTLFLGSSSNAKSQAKLLISSLSSDIVEFLPWWDAFIPGQTLLHEIEGIATRVQGALLLFSPEIPSTVRGKEVHTPNQNVLFEFGYFLGKLGKKSVATIRYGEFYLPSDLGGYIHITGSKFFKPGASTKVGKRTTTDFTRWAAGLAQSTESSNLISLVEQKSDTSGVSVKNDDEDARRFRLKRQIRDRNWKTL